MTETAVEVPAVSETVVEEVPATETPEQQRKRVRAVGKEIQAQRKFADEQAASRASEQQSGAGEYTPTEIPKSEQPKKVSGAAGSPVVPLLLIGLGGYLLWFGVKYWRGTGPAVWPSYPIKSVLQGKGLPANQQAPSTIAAVTSYESGGTAGQQPPAAGEGTAPIPPGASQGQAQNTAKLLLPSYGWGDSSQLQALISLWDQESQWNPKARNPSSGALGIAQALGHGTSGTAGSLGNEYGAEYGLSDQQAAAANSGSVVWQIKWGLGYIRARYGSPVAAWTHEQTAGWY